MDTAQRNADRASALGRALAVLVLLAGLLLAAGLCVAAPPENPIPNIFQPHSTPANVIDHLSYFVLEICALIFIFVFSLLVYAIIKFRARADDTAHEPAQVYGSTQIELAWTVIPILIVVVLFLATARVIHALQDAPKPASAVDVIAIGHQFWWEFRYPSLGVVTANELHIPVSDPAHPTPTFVKLLSADTDHSFWVPQLAGKIDLIPNRVNEIWLDPHADWRLPWPVRAILRHAARQNAPARFRGLARGFRRLGPSRKATGAARMKADVTGRRVFETTACINCHAVSGTPANGRFGPDLTHLMSRATIASGAARQHPRKSSTLDSGSRRLKPGSLMPAMKLSDADLDALVNYLETLR